MARATILFVDNQKEVVDTYKDHLEAEGYRVIPAYNYDQACVQLQKGGVALAVLDLHLIDDQNEKDFSGITLARETDHTIPKIILTAKPSFEAVREMYRPQLDGLPAGVEFVLKEDGIQALFEAVELGLGPDLEWLRSIRRALQKTDELLERDYANAQNQSQTYFIVSIIAAISGVLLAFAGIGLVYLRQIQMGWVGPIVAAITEAVSVLFFLRADKANDRMDQYHKERMEGQRFETLLRSCEGFIRSEEGEVCRNRILLAAIQKWLLNWPDLSTPAHPVDGHSPTVSQG